MVERFKSYLNEEFRGIDRTKEVIEFKEELLSNLVDKYQELINTGYGEEKAFIDAIKSIGDLSLVIKEYKTTEESNNFSKSNIEYSLYKHKKEEDYIYDKTKNKTKIWFMISYGLLISSFFLYIGISSISNTTLAFVLALLLIIIGFISFILCYQSFSTVLSNLLDGFNSRDYYIKGFSFLMKNGKGFGISVVWLLLLILFYTMDVINNGFYYQQIYVNNYTHSLLVMAGILISWFIVLTINKSHIEKLRRANFDISNKTMSFYLYHYGYLPLLLFFVNITDHFDYYFYISIILCIIQIAYDVFMVKKEKQVLSFRFIRILFALLYVILIFLISIEPAYYYGYITLQEEGQISSLLHLYELFSIIGVILTILIFIYNVLRKKDLKNILNLISVFAFLIVFWVSSTNFIISHRFDFYQNRVCELIFDYEHFTAILCFTIIDFVVRLINNYQKSVKGEINNG